MKFSCLNKTLVREMFPRFGTLEDQLITRDLMKKLELSSIDMQDIGLNQDEKGNITTHPNWKNGSDINIELSENEIKVLKNAVNFIDNAGRVTPEMIDICLEIKAL